MIYTKYNLSLINYLQFLIVLIFYSSRKNKNKNSKEKYYNEFF